MSKRNTKSYQMNFATMTLTITKDFQNKANDPASEEYEILQQFQKDFPGLKVVNRTHKTPTQYKTRTGEVLKRNKTKGLTYERMERFISTFPNSKALMEQYDYCKTQGVNPYSAVVKWFEVQFPNFRSNPLYYLNNNDVVVVDASCLMELEKAAS